MELVVKPNVIFLDEPTTGLDATTAFQVIEILQKLAKSTNRVIIMSIHQPRYSIYKLFDSITLLALGRTSFQGTPEEAFQFFKKHGYECPKHYNPADHFLDVINGDSTATGANEYANKKRNNNTGNTNAAFSDDEYANDKAKLNLKLSNDSGKKHNISYLSSVGDQTQDDLEKNQTSIAQQFNNYFLNDALYSTVKSKVDEIVNTADNSGKKIKISETQETGLLKQFKTIGLRNLKNLKRNPAGLVANCIVNLIFSIVIGIMFLQVVDTGVEACQNRIGVLFFLSTNIMFSAQEVGNLFAQERILYIREICSGYYRPFPYFMAKVLCDFIPIRTIPAIFYSGVCYWIVGLLGCFLRNENWVLLADFTQFWDIFAIAKLPILSFSPFPWADFGAWIMFFLIVLIESYCAASLSAMYATWIDTFALVQIAITLTFVFMLAFAGLLVNIETIVPWLSWIQYLSIPRYALVGFSINEFSGGHVTFCNTTVGVDNISGIEWVETTLDTTVDYDQYWISIVALGAMAIGFLVIGFILLTRIKITT